MAGITFEKGKKIYAYGQPMTALHLIKDGKVQVTYPGGSYLLERGAVIGVCEICSEIHFLEYSAAEDTTLLTYPLSSIDSLGDLMQQHFELSRIFLLSAFHQINALFYECSLSEPKCHNMYGELKDAYEKYVSVCNSYHLPVRTLEGMDELSAYLSEEDSDMWLSGLYLGLQHIYSGEHFRPLVSEPGISIGFIRKCSLDFRRNYTVLEEHYLYRKQFAEFYFNDSENDLFDFYTSLYFKLGPDCDEASVLFAGINSIVERFRNDPATCTPQITERIQRFRDRLTMEQTTPENRGNADKEYDLSDLKNSLNTILRFAAAPSQLASDFKQNLLSYKALPDKSDTEDDTCRLRKKLAENFHQMYSVVFKRTLETEEIPMPVKMFLYFGYVDEELAGEENSALLYQLAKSRPNHTEFGVYTFYDWLLAIYHGKKEPSRNEFDQDYSAYIHKQKATGNLSEAEFQELENSAMGKVDYELENLFPSVNKMTFGRPASYCPVFVSDNVLKNLSDSYVKLTDVNRALETIKNVDYSAFYRESLDVEHMDIMGKEPIHLEFLPDIILMPNVGTRGVMWQEIQGKTRNSKSRMVFPVFHAEDFTSSMIRLTGEFRWEMCKRVQGGRWNDVSERSLTSEYFDYIQFYRKNHDLTNEAKEKIRTSLQRAKNSFKEMFVRDYIIWVMFEGTGSPRLNKVARRILFTYCPFSASVMATAGQNPLYTELISRHQIQMKQKLHHIDMLSKKIMNSGVSLPDTLRDEKKYISGDF